MCSNWFPLPFPLRYSRAFFPMHLHSLALSCAPTTMSSYSLLLVVRTQCSHVQHVCVCAAIILIRRAWDNGLKQRWLNGQQQQKCHGRWGRGEKNLIFAKISALSMDTMAWNGNLRYFFDPIHAHHCARILWKSLQSKYECNWIISIAIYYLRSSFVWHKMHIFAQYRDASKVCADFSMKPNSHTLLWPASVTVAICRLPLMHLIHY